MLDSGTMLGPYRIVAAIGAGGMGEVYRALDTRLGRDVAVKVLSETYSRDAEALRRFEQEARAASMLNHPNITAVYDIGVEEGRRYIVSELLEGESLRARIRQGPMSARKVAEYAVQIARGLAAAHEKGIIHRDLKPENLFLTRDGQVKILDFGLVKLVGTRVPGMGGNVDEHAPTLPPTEPGRILGTVGYMAPEQVRGASGDHRSDIFSFGAIVYEMLSGRPAFRGESPIETLNAILKEEPVDLVEQGIRVPGALERVIRHCLEKSPEDRFQSSRDLAFGLGEMSGLTSQAIPFRTTRIRWRSLIKPAIALLAAAILAGLAFVYGRTKGTRPPPRYERLTFRSGTIFSARFSPDGQTVFYGARWGGSPVSVYSVRPDSPESRDMGFGVSEILAVSSTGELAIALRRHPIGYLRDAGTLAQVAISGGAPREILEDVESADWTPDGRALAIVRMVDGKSRLEYPIGQVLYSTQGWISHPRFAPDGRSIAFIDHPIANDDRGTIASIDLKSRERKTLTEELQSVQGLAWHPTDGRIWFSAESLDALGRTLRAVKPGGKSMVVATTAGSLWLHDISRDGRILASQQKIRAGILAAVDGEMKERDLSWLDYSVIRDLSSDGTKILFSESGEAGGSNFGIYLRGIDGAPAIKLGEGTSEALSPDGRWVLSIPRDKKPAPVLMLPTGTGQPRSITNDRMDHRTARWFPDGKRILFAGSEGDKPPQVWVQSVDGGAPRAITPARVLGNVVTPDGRFILGRTTDRKFNLYPVDGGSVTAVPALERGDVPVRFSIDGRSLFVTTFGKIPAQLTRVDLQSGQRSPVRDVIPAEAAGLINVGPVWPSADGKTIVYSYTRLLSDLYLIQY
jgi:eukaryotic-like serine/threonine-protein kinase